MSFREIVERKEDGIYGTRSEAVRLAIDDRDEAWGQFGIGEHNAALVRLGESVTTLEDCMRSLGTGCPEEERISVVRELYASRSRLACASAVVGDYSDAARIALAAAVSKPRELRLSVGMADAPGYAKSKLPVGMRFTGFIGMSIPDQYEIMFAGRLSLVLGTSEDEHHIDTAQGLANWAKANYWRSQNPKRAAFTERGMSMPRRVASRAHLYRVARAAQRGINSPIEHRQDMARRILAP